MAAVRIKASDSFINAPYPTPVGLATGYGAWAVQEAIVAAASSALQAAGGGLADRTTAQWAASFPCYIFAGASNQHGQRALFLSKDTSGVGQGAMRGLDGSGGPFVSLHGSIPSVEAHEAQEPLLFLSRQNWTDSGGAGTWRGGVGIRSAVIVWGEKSAPLSGTFCTGRNAIPEYGLYGGYPASGVYYGPIAGTDAWERLQSGEVSTLDDLEERFGDQFESLPSKAVWQGRREIGKGPGSEVFVMTHPGGGGYGDPLARDPEAVALDVAEGIVSPQAATGAYGVVVDGDGAVDVDATTRSRELLRRERISRAGDSSGAPPGPPSAEATGSPASADRSTHQIQIGPVAWDPDADAVSCRVCEQRLCSPAENWKDACVIARGSAFERLRSEEFGARWRIRAHEEVELAEMFCPHCHAILAVEWYLRGEPFRWTYRTIEGARVQGYDAAADFGQHPEEWLVF
jgi:N-methylhydantoinase B